MSTKAKQQLRDFRNAASCGEELYLTERGPDAYRTQAEKRYELEPFIADFADFDGSKGLRMLEIGVGLGADHQRFAAFGAQLTGLDLTDRAIQHTQARFASCGLNSKLVCGDAEALPFPAESFDLVYSWGVLHHSPDTPRAVAEVHRVLVRGGVGKIMIYQKWSMVGLMLWTRYALLRLRPWRGLKSIYAEHQESPGTKAYSVTQARKLFSQFKDVRIRTVMTYADLLQSDVGQKHRGPSLALAQAIWPRRLISSVVRWAGLFMLIEARK